MADYRASLLREECLPLAFIWRTGFWDVIGRVLRRALDARRPDSAMNADTDFMLDRLDDALEPLAREEGGKMHWDEIETDRTACHQGSKAAFSRRSNESRGWCISRTPPWRSTSSHTARALS